MRGKPSFHCPTLFSLKGTLTPAWETVADNSAEERNEKENKARGKMDSRGKKGIFRARGKGEKKKRYFAVLMGES